MATKDITDIQVLKAYQLRQSTGKTVEIILMEITGQPEKVCFRAMERVEARGYIDCGVSLRTGWLTAEGEAKLLNES